MDLNVKYENMKNAEEAYKEALKEITPEYISKWNLNADVTCDEANKKMKAKGKGFELRLEFKEAECQVFLDLSFLLKPLKKTVLETIERKLTKHL